MMVYIKHIKYIKYTNVSRKKFIKYVFNRFVFFSKLAFYYFELNESLLKKKK